MLGPHGYGTTAFRVRPVIGDSFPAEGKQTGDRGAHAGSWVTATTGGTVAVKLQVSAVGEASEPFFMNPDWQSVSWTLMVFPQGNVPAVGNIGLVVLVAVLLAAGSVVITRRGRSVSA